MNTKLLDNYNYGLLMLHKYKVIRSLDNIIDRSNELSLPIINLLSLYLMDTNNGDGELLTKEEISNVNNLIKLYKDNPNRSIGIERKDLNYILSHFLLIYHLIKNYYFVISIYIYLFALFEFLNF